MGQDDLLSPKAAIDYLHKIDCPISRTFFDKLRREGRGPPHTKNFQRIVRFRRGDLEIWVKKNTTRIE